MFDDVQELLNQDWTGRCYEAATTYAGTAKDKDLLVVHGSICANGRRVKHAWCESGDNVVDLASPGRKIFARSEYYQLLAPDVRQRLSVKDALLFSFAHGYVAWEEVGQELDGRLVLLGCRNGDATPCHRTHPCPSVASVVPNETNCTADDPDGRG